MRNRRRTERGEIAGTYQEMALRRRLTGSKNKKKNNTIDEILEKSRGEEMNRKAIKEWKKGVARYVQRGDELKKEMEADNETGDGRLEEGERTTEGKNRKIGVGKRRERER